MRLPPTLDIANEQVRDDLLRSAVMSEEVVVDGEDVTRVDGAGLQLLCAFVASVTSRGGRVTWRSASPQLVHAARILRVDGYLGLPRT